MYITINLHQDVLASRMADSVILLKVSQLHNENKLFNFTANSNQVFWNKSHEHTYQSQV